MQSKKYDHNVRAELPDSILYAANSILVFYTSSTYYIRNALPQHDALDVFHVFVTNIPATCDVQDYFSAYIYLPTST